jgi:hypothetical protein
VVTTRGSWLPASGSKLNELERGLFTMIQDSWRVAFWKPVDTLPCVAVVFYNDLYDDIRVALSTTSGFSRAMAFHTWHDHEEHVEY